MATTNTQADGDSQAVSGDSMAGKDQATVLGGTNNRNNLGGEYTVGTNSTLTINGASGVEALASKFAETLAQINDTASLDKAGSDKVVQDALDKVAKLSDAKLTDGISSIGKIALWGLAIAAAVAAVFFWTKNK